MSGIGMKSRAVSRSLARWLSRSSSKSSSRSLRAKRGPAHIISRTHPRPISARMRAGVKDARGSAQPLASSCVSPASATAPPDILPPLGTPARSRRSNLRPHAGYASCFTAYSSSSTATSTAVGTDTIAPGTPSSADPSNRATITASPGSPTLFSMMRGVR
jgi:hypothetical protein